MIVRTRTRTQCSRRTRGTGERTNVQRYHGAGPIHRIANDAAPLALGAGGEPRVRSCPVDRRYVARVVGGVDGVLRIKGRRCRALDPVVASRAVVKDGERVPLDQGGAVGAQVLRVEVDDPVERQVLRRSRGVNLIGRRHPVQNDPDQQLPEAGGCVAQLGGRRRGVLGRNDGRRGALGRNDGRRRLTRWDLHAFGTQPSENV